MVCALSLRGGGIRAYSTAILLAEVEKQLRKPLHQAFDLIGGTSAGAIIATGLALGIKAEDLVSFFECEGEYIFKSRRFFKLVHMLGHPRFNTSNLRDALDRHFVKESKLAHVSTRLMVTSTRYEGLESKLWKSWKHDHMRASDVAASSAAAPTYFDSVELSGFHFCDGGLWAQNPAAYIVTEAKKIWPAHDVAIVDIACPDEKSGFLPHRGGALEFLPHIVEVFMGAGQDASSYLARRWIGANGRMVTVAPKLLDASHDIGDASPANLKRLRRCAEDRMDHNVKEILRVIGNGKRC